MDDLAGVTGGPRPLNVDGRVYQIHPLTIEDFATLEEWVNAQFPDPFDIVNEQIARGRPVRGEDGTVRREPYTMAQQQFLYKLAVAEAARGRKSLGSPEADAVMLSVAGLKEAMYTSLRKGDPDFTREDAAALFRKMSFVHLARVQALMNLDMVVSPPDPKAPTPAGPTPTDQAE